MKTQTIKIFNKTRFKRFIFAILFVGFAVLSMLNHNITTAFELGNEVLFYILIGLVADSMIKNFTIQEAKEVLFNE